MRQFRDLPLGRRLIIAMMLASCVTLLLSSLSFITHDIFSMRKSAGEDMETLAQIVGAASAASIVFNDAKSAYETLDMLADQEHITVAAIYNASGEVLAEYHAGSADTGSLPAPLGVRQTLFVDNDVEVYSPVLLDGKSVGSVFIRSDLSKLQQRVDWYLRMVVLVLVFSLCVAYVLSRFLQRVLAGPVVELAALARRITTDRNYGLRAARESGGEVGDLIVSFNEMLDEIQSRDKALAAHRDRLEDTIARRTAEIERANVDLELAKEKAETAAARLAHQAFHDALTGLPNRSLLNDRLAIALAHARRTQTRLALLFLDLDDFKLINDTLGHEVGDELLCCVADILKNCLRSEDTVARLGGDEFMVLLPDIEHREDAGRVAQMIIERLSRPLECTGRELHLAVSIGISIFPEDGVESVDLMRSADASMYRAKAAGRNLFMYYQTEIGADSSRRLAMENQLRRALERNELFLDYQVQVSGAEQRIVGVEALVRWRNPEFGLVPPDQFIPLAEDIGLISEIGEWVLQEACGQGCRWHAAGFADLKIAVNLSPRQFRRTQVEDMVRRVLADTGFSARCLELEITENLSMQNIQTTIETLGILNECGVRLSLDDFGTGYSSLSYLTRLPVHALKIDRAFVRDIPDNRDDAALARAIVVMAQQLGLEVVAEGVETVQQLRFFKEIGCDTLQGYLFGRPQSPDAIGQLLEQCGADRLISVSEPV